MVPETNSRTPSLEIACVRQSPPGGFDDILSEQILMVDNQCLDRPVSFDHLTRSRRGSANPLLA